ncbi:tRNA preQ1(34) S-adenosylmethionine ribosyltransferase-isomerase QueA [Campylobacter sp. MIT 99-7217]|uniref:tRNA preQ1(34) S-adenosylmethionine ribosyltransferase-isomerase QueA n=1 Tax=Campylobacter sp. MIT 99-7217 TaxID=535091 RepID=UPI00115B40F6|nr:tRNA preQ1(34) S-adenosylmethionine ribosyltransferase-isomerase QueA [Campylobacter sp. MIT 99-7217]TQR33720.1 tRNA preQ1(34) S-adenosylmethionine ribosyltransferase-isomerase QueA [Campylobacter sp. MIT 99-7217]
MNEDLFLKNYDYFLPKELIASKPLEDKEQTRLLIYERSKDKIIHTKFKYLQDFLPNCAIIFNDTKVIKARIFAKKPSGKLCELFFHKNLSQNEFLVQIKGRVKKGDFLDLEKGIKIKILKLNEDGTRVVRFIKNELFLKDSEVFSLLEKIGHIPLPPYIKRADEKDDEKDYQSIFAKNLGAVAAPTASLHFDEKILKKLAKNHDFYTLTLHVGAGTFKGVECENIKDHFMHKEAYELEKKLIELIKSKEPMLCVGTTTTRAIEYFVRTKLEKGWCDLFLNPFNKPLRVNHLLTNFHLPKTSLIMLVASFIGRKKTLELYEEAIKEKYRFYSYGDAMLLV